MADVLKLAFGQPEEIAFKFPTGKEVQGRFGPQIAFSAVDRAGKDQILYLDKDPAIEVERNLQQLGIRTREFFRIVKVKEGNYTRINLERIQQPTNGTAAGAHSWQGNAPAPVQQAAPATSERAQVTTPPTLTARLCATACSLIDAMIEAKAYAERNGLNVTNDDLRALINTAFIAESRR